MILDCYFLISLRQAGADSVGVQLINQGKKQRRTTHTKNNTTKNKAAAANRVVAILRLLTGQQNSSTLRKVEVRSTSEISEQLQIYRYRCRNGSLTFLHGHSFEVSLRMFPIVIQGSLFIGAQGQTTTSRRTNTHTHTKKIKIKSK